VIEVDAPSRRSVPYVGVVGPGDPDEHRDRVAEDVGRLLAESGAVVVCGGLGGVMAGACRGAESVGGLSLGILPGSDRAEANEWVTVPVATGLGELRNALVVSCSDALVAVGGGYGTLSEIGFALRSGLPVVGLGTWSLTGPDAGGTSAAIRETRDAVEAVSVALMLAERRRVAGGGTG
jgi:hypothetical protein